MISKTQAEFWACYNSLPAEIHALANEKYRLWEQDCFHSSLQFKGLIDNVWSVRINQKYRALGRRNGNLIVWFWVGTHSEYDALIRRLA